MNIIRHISTKLLLGIMLLAGTTAWGQSGNKTVSDKVMQEVYQEIKTPFKYGLVLTPDSNNRKMDCPTVFRKGNQWYMVYIIFDGRGYETWLAKSKDLLNWKTTGRIMSFSDTTDWDSNQKAGYLSLQDTKWGGSYQLEKYNNKYWMSYFGGSSKGYEKGLLSISMAYTDNDPTTPHEWQRLGKPVLMATDSNVQWWDNHTLYKETVIWDKKKSLGHPFIMYYNANGDSVNKKRGAERIGMAFSDDMVTWKRAANNPILNHNVGITGDPYIQKIGDVWVMFYFGAFWKDKGGAFNRFACSYDLANWTEWKGDDLIQSSEPYDNMFAHKSFVVKYKGVVYHFYCAVNKADQRGIAVATSKDMGKSTVGFIAPPPSKAKKN
ncbi:glycosylase [Mucilaginibacter sp. PAMB04274]|uniref:glycosylase n=1 Tax=Mucilaginibacter sp. PAMB04274 TaxID=3138568 RepID=UPI0031F5FB82